MNQKRHQSAPSSPLDPYRSIIEQNPIDEHFTNKRLKKHIRHVGLIPKPLDKENRDSTSLAHDEHKIQNSRPEKFKQFQQKFIFTMADAVGEVDRARQAEFRKQLDLWDKMYSNRIQRLKANDARIEQKYGLFIDRQIKKELIRENLSQLPGVPSVLIPQVLPPKPRSKPKSKPKEKPVPNPSSTTVIDNSDEIKSLRLALEHLEKSSSKKIEKLENELSLVKNHLNAQQISMTHNQSFSPSNISHTQNYDNYFENIQFKQQQFDNSLKTLTKNIDKCTKSVDEAHNHIKQINNKIDSQHQQLEQLINDNLKKINFQHQQLEQLINDNLKKIEKQIDTLTNQFNKTLEDEINKVKNELKILKDKPQQLEQTTNQLQLPNPIKKKMITYVEKIPPQDLFEIDWSNCIKQ